MGEKESPTNLPWQIFNTAEFAKFGQMQTEALSNAQLELSNLLQEASEDWRSRAELERKLATELMSKLTTAKTLPDAAKAYQEWMVRRIDMVAKDGQKILADGQKYVSALSRFLPRGDASK